MKVAYGIAVIAAIGIMIGIVMMPPNEPNAENQTSSTTPVKSEEVMAESGTLTMHVPEMHCAVMCYPKIKKTLEADSKVQVVELAPQKEEGIIDDPKVIINYEAGFNVDAAIATLAENGYANSEKVQ